jgi:streptogramin lyase/uncharacterized protein YkwD
MSRKLSLESLEQRTVPDAVPLNNFEQYFLELTNRARQDPAAEAKRLGIDLNEGLAPGTITTAAKQPLAPNAELLTAIRGHLQDMIKNQFFGHTGSDGSDPGKRISDAGYPFTTWGENLAVQGAVGTPDETALTLAAYQSLFIDSNTAGRGHRTNLLNGDFKELGPGEATGLFMGFNGVYVGQDFGTRAGNSFLTGVVYTDTARTNFYAPGEGLAQVTITAVSDQGVTTMDVTGSAGGYTLQLAPGTYTVTASGGMLQSPMTVRNIVIGTSNVEQDFIIPAAVPTLSVSTTTVNLGTTPVATAGSPQTYTISGSNLSANVVIAAPGGVELSTDGTNYSSTLTLTPGNGKLATTTISARISAAAPPGTISGKISDISTGATEQDVSVSGMVITQAQSFQVVAPTNVVAGMPFGVTVSAVDAFGNTVTTYTGTIHFSTSDTSAGVMLPADYTFTAADKGVHTFNGLVLGTAGSTSLTVSDVRFSEFSIATAKSGPSGITVGPDGNLWFTEANGNKVAKITPAGAITEFGVSDNPIGITAGPDGNLWFTESNGNKIGRITPDGSAVMEFPIPTNNSFPFPRAITTGPDGNLWFSETDGNQIGQITPDGSTLMEFPIPTNNSFPQGITVGPDGNLWFTEAGGNQIGQITPDGSTVMEFPIPTNNSTPFGITAGPDGNLWFTEANGNKIGQITPTGTILEFPILTTNSEPFGITTGPDGNLWFTEMNGNKVGRITPTGTILEFPIPTGSSGPFGITTGPDGNLWFTENNGNKVGRITSIFGTATVMVTPGGGGGAARSLGAAHFGGIPGGSDGSAWATVPSATARPLAASADPESWRVRAQAVAATAHRAALIEPVGSDLADLLFSRPWLEGLEWHAGR